MTPTYRRQSLSDMMTGCNGRRCTTRKRKSFTKHWARELGKMVGLFEKAHESTKHEKYFIRFRCTIPPMKRAPCTCGAPINFGHASTCERVLQFSIRRVAEDNPFLHGKP